MECFVVAVVASLTNAATHSFFIRFLSSDFHVSNPYAFSSMNVGTYLKHTFFSFTFLELFIFIMFPKIRKSFPVSI